MYFLIYVDSFHILKYFFDILDYVFSICHYMVVTSGQGQS